MLRVALAFFALAVLAYLMGATGVGGMTMELARVVLGIFLVIGVVSAALGLVGNPPKGVP